MCFSNVCKRPPGPPLANRAWATTGLGRQLGFGDPENPENPEKPEITPARKANARPESKPPPGKKMPARKANARPERKRPPGKQAPARNLPKNPRSFKFLI